MVLLASGGGDRSVRLWDVATLVPKGGALLGHEDQVYSVAFSPDSALLASGSVDSSVRLWDTSGGCCLRVLSARNDATYRTPCTFEF